MGKQVRIAWKDALGQRVQSVLELADDDEVVYAGYTVSDLAENRVMFKTGPGMFFGIDVNDIYDYEVL